MPWISGTEFLLFLICLTKRYDALAIWDLLDKSQRLLSIEIQFSEHMTTICCKKWSHYDLIQNEISYALCVGNFVNAHTIRAHRVYSSSASFFSSQRKKLINKYDLFSLRQLTAADLIWLNWHENDIPFFFEYLRNHVFSLLIILPLGVHSMNFN